MHYVLYILPYCMMWVFSTTFCTQETFVFTPHQTSYTFSDDDCYTQDEIAYNDVCDRSPMPKNSWLNTVGLKIYSFWYTQRARFKQISQTIKQYIYTWYLYFRPTIYQAPSHGS